ncbi:hypothetical protein ACLK2E_06565 [Escherichia coli]
MVWMALPYTLVLTLVGLACVEFTLDAGDPVDAGAGLAGDASAAEIKQYPDQKSGYPISPFRLRNIFRLAAGVASVVRLHCQI